MDKKIAVVGGINYDTFFSLKNMPKIGENVIADSSKSAPGGKGANQAVQAAKLGIPTTMIGCIGDDLAGQSLKDSLFNAGVNINYLKTQRGEETGKGDVDVFPDGRVMAVLSKGANYALSIQDIENARKIISDADLLILQLEIPLEVVIKAVEIANQCGTMVMLNAAPAVELPESLIQSCDFFIVNEVECSFYAGQELDSVQKAREVLPDLARKYRNKWVCTLGELGSTIAYEDQFIYIPAIETEVLETTGAGDSFIGGFAYGILNDMNIYDAGVFASYCSAITISDFGAQNSMPSREQLNKKFHI